MRFPVLVACCGAAGALGMGAVEQLFPRTAQTFQAMIGVGGKAGDFRLIEIDPLKAYEEIKSKIASGELTAPIGVGSPVTVKPLAIDPSRFALKIDENQIRRAMAAGIQSQIQRNYERSQALITYGRNPMAWHGPPPW